MSFVPSAFAGVVLALAGAGFGVVHAVAHDDAEGGAAARHIQSTTPLRESADDIDRYVGVAVRADALADDEDYRSIAAYDFNMLTLENELKWSEIHAEPGEIELTAARRMIDFATDHDMAVRGHTLVWHRQNPGWLDESRLGRDQAIELLRIHIDTVVGAFRGRVAHWDVVNEPLDPNGSGLREHFWFETIGPEYLDIAFQLAHAADPDARLFLNDFDGVGDGAKFDALIDLAVELRGRDVPVHGVGFQHHLSGSLDAEIAASLVDRAADAGLEVAFTEVDDRLPANAGQVERVEQARRLAALAEVCVRRPACTTFVVWGVGDGYSWIPDAFPGFGGGTLFDEGLEAKPAYHFVADVFRAAALRQRMASS